MKKKPASASETSKANAVKSQRVRKTDAKTTSTAAKSSATEKPKRSPRKPLFDAAVDTVKKIFQPKAAPKPAVAKKTGKSEIKSEAEAPTASHRSPSRAKKDEPLAVPPILLEGDEPLTSPIGGPGEKYSLGATPPAQSFSGGELPESYGTKKLFLTARDPHWLYAHWDLTREQQHALNNESTDGHLILRIFTGKIEGHPAYEIHVHPESRLSLIHI